MNICLFSSLKPYPLKKGQTITSVRYVGPIGVFEEGNREKPASYPIEKTFLHQYNAACHRSIKTMAKIYKLHFEMLLHSPYSPPLTPSDQHLLVDHNEMLTGKRSVSKK